MAKSKHKKHSVDPEDFEDLPQVEKIHKANPKEESPIKETSLNGGDSHNAESQDFLTRHGLR